ncbi:MAG: HEAT repeat domain-containing protein [bacterium]|nr:HEAT repeat domain-containing protein [bacterium]
MFGTRLACVLVAAAALEPVQDPGIIEFPTPISLGSGDFYSGLERGLVGGPFNDRTAAGLLSAEVTPPGGLGDDATLRSFVTRFLGEESPWRLFLLAQHLRVQTTRRWGTLWTIDHQALGQLTACAAIDPDPVRRAFALLALQDRHGFQSRGYLDDDEPLVRLAAASVLAAPGGVTEADAARVVGALLALLEEARPEFRAAAAGALGPWVFREPHLVRLADVADSDPAPCVRAAALRSLGAVGSLRVREQLRRVRLDEASGADEREAAWRGFARTGIVP